MDLRSISNFRLLLLDIQFILLEVNKNGVDHGAFTEIKSFHYCKKSFYGF
ncbi:hypothetical protein O6H91_08G118900 [Diphasiastrum complanatum]|uniref:Uncharacterized protein n=1 Tax=Diphasiastrum complanatum TaxID=34168 RepID=A0ACC2D1I8_DIPCM|nr:hypothetical protein O6H91_08G118900 [Diphasiastrum complanatum]